MENYYFISKVRQKQTLLNICGGILLLVGGTNEISNVVTLYLLNVYVWLFLSGTKRSGGLYIC